MKIGHSLRISRIPPQFYSSTFKQWILCSWCEDGPINKITMDSWIYLCSYKDAATSRVTSIPTLFLRIAHIVVQPLAHRERETNTWVTEKKLYLALTRVTNVLQSSSFSKIFLFFFIFSHWLYQINIAGLWIRCSKISKRKSSISWRLIFASDCWFLHSLTEMF